MSEYWLISAPGDKTCQQTFETMNNLTSKQAGLCTNHKFHIPDLKVGTLDQLVGLSDDLGKLDNYVEQVTRKVATYLGEVLEDQRDKLQENLLANNSPGPPDEIKTAHLELTGKSSNLSNSRDTTTTSCSACQSGSCNNFSSTESERDFDLLSTSPICCNCDDCAEPASLATTTNLTAAASSSSSSTSQQQQQQNHHQHHLPHNQQPQLQQQQHHHHHDHQHQLYDDCFSSQSTIFSSFNATTSTFGTSTCTTLTTCAASASAAAVVAAASAACVAVNCTSSCCLASAPTSVGLCSQHSCHRFNHNIINNNNNTCNINNNNNNNSKKNMGLRSNSHSHVSHSSHNNHNANNDDHIATVTKTTLKPNSSTSDVSDTFDWWFHRHRRHSKKSSKSTPPSQINYTINNGINFTSTHRSSPVSSCCGSSSQGRSSPDTDLGEPPAFPLSPADLSVYITRFQWDMAKYPIKQSLRNIADIISKQVGQIDADLKTKSAAYNNLKGSLQNLEKRQTGSLLTRNLIDLVKKEHFVLDSDYLTTVLVIVPKLHAQEWLAKYEHLTDMIVPRSSQLITEDHDYCLFNVTLFKKVVEEFKLHAREKKFMVRDFVYNEEELAAGKNEITKLLTDKKKQFGPLVRWLKVNFSEAFCALVHVKALRVFVESVLRYGLPVNFQAILIEPHKKSMKRLRDVLNQLYGHLDGASAAGNNQSNDNVDIPGLGFGQADYYPYVFYKLNIDMITASSS